MTNRRRLFRVEAMHGAPAGMASSGPVAIDHFADRRHQEVLREVAALKQMVTDLAKARPSGSDDSGRADEVRADIAHLDEEFKHLKQEMHEAQKLKVELDSMHEAISQTKREIASLHVNSFEGKQMTRVTDELDEVVQGTEQATEKILAAVETIDEQASNLAARLTNRDQDMAADIQDKVVGIYEACNFQDITGQRITKVVNALRFVENRISRMMEIWGGIDSFKEVESEIHEEKVHSDADKALLNGPAQQVDEGVASQDDIDALFA
ncbi:chemotaxis protein CheZ [Rhodobium orientis]|uniref:Uncharacterized protein n=1 Tax=Rhodobium orientis TaxID=34017 RepID=A0A327JR11_9HYPH|nr:protein phosphatase CheZ [Rhodobium orientis]MBB4304160.1 chemotaxis protein CheZ [Rhodobium orientis]MBK5950631.1 hypothetical protein [Rhodobium orientis]RAI28016.1 hypothetical protein CH339_07885 [Rhodobium orientis]